MNNTFHRAHPAPTPGRWPSWRSIFARLPIRALVVLLALLNFNLAQPARAQSHVEDTSDHLPRKVVSRVNPEYPMILRVASIGGVVKLNATVLANGSVSKVTVLGGNPILADRALRAVMLWKFAPAAGPTNEIIALNFRPN